MKKTLWTRFLKFIFRTVSMVSSRRWFKIALMAIFLFTIMRLSISPFRMKINESYNNLPSLTLDATNHKTCIFTISALNNFGFVLNLYDSVITHNPDIDCFIWYMGDISIPTNERAKSGLEEIRGVIGKKKYLTLVTMEDMGSKLDDFEPLKIAFKFDLVELQTTIKPFAFLYTFQEFGAQSAMFFDNDIWVTDSLEEIQKQLSIRSAVVTPHIISPIPEDGKMQKDINILQCGVFNFGFVAFSNTAASINFLNFWGERLNIYGYVKLSKGMFYDQNWGMFIPVFFDTDDYYVIRDIRYNIAYWNLHYTGAGLHMKNGQPYMDHPETKKAEKTVFIHFSGISVLENYDMEVISKHQTRFTLKDFPRIKDVFMAYAERVTSFNTLHYRDLPYGYNDFTSGIKIEPWMKEVYAEAVLPEGKGSFVELGPQYLFDVSISPYVKSTFEKTVFHQDPFCDEAKCLPEGESNKITFSQWLMQTSLEKAVDMDGHYFYSIYDDRLWKSRPDLQAFFPDPTGRHYDAFKEWFEIHAVSDNFLTEGLFRKWKDTWKYQEENHYKIHKRVIKSDDIGVNVYGWHAGLFSIGIVAKKLFRSAKLVGLSANAIEAAMVPSRRFMLPDEIDIDLTRSCSEPVNLVVVNADSTSVFLNDIPGIIRDEKYNIAYWNWELDIFPLDWMHTLKYYDEVWCSSLFIKKSIETSKGYDGTVVKVLPIPNEIDDTLSEDQSSDQLSTPSMPSAIQKYLRAGKKRKPFVFLVVFDFQSYVDRKNPEAAIRAFIDAFPIDEDKEGKYELIVKTHSGTSDDVDKLMKVAKGDPRVVVINSLLSEEENDALHQYQDCYVSLHRSEGYGMNILETMASGIPVIATNYSGNVDFFTTMPSFQGKCTFPIPYKLVELKEDVGPYLKGNHWAEADHKSAVMAMRDVVKSDCKRLYGTEMRRQVDANFGSQAVGAIMKSHLDESLHQIIAKQRKYANVS